MFKNAITIVLTLIIGWTMVLVTGCESNAQTGAGVGALMGAGIGAIAGHQSGRAAEGALIGGAVGGGTGYIVGNESDKAKTRTQMYAMRQDIDSRIVNVRNSNGSIVQVRLRRCGAGWLGTRGEYYPTLPSSKQLRPVYGF
jgi:outer membrane lipoprotein SlyB